MSNSVTNKVAVAFWLALGRWFERKGLQGVAASCYRNMPGDLESGAEARFRLSQIYLSEKRDREAAELCEAALQAYPKHARLWCALGAARRRLMQMDEAGEAYREAVAIDPNYAQAWCNLGEWHLQKSKLAEALENFDRALKLEPRLVQALNNRAAALYELARFEEAEKAAREAIELYPDQAELHVNLGNVLLYSGKARLSADSFKRALELDPGRMEAQLGLSTLLGETHRLAQTIEHFEQEIAIKGESAQRLVMLASAQQANRDWVAAETNCRKALEMQPDNVTALITLSSCCSTRADHQAAIELQEKALQQNPAMSGIISNLAFSATYLPNLSPEEVFDFHRRSAEKLQQVEPGKIHSHPPGTEPERKLRIGYVSGDFGLHPVGHLIRDVLRHHDSSRFTVICYSMMRHNDDPITQEIRKHADVWVESLFLNDDELAQHIVDDKIDILIDLSGHTAYTRLPVFARRPAPVQATWIGYFHSTGMTSIDYLITDPHTTPRDAGQLFSEHPAFLPHSRFCYSPPDFAPPVAPPPMLANGFVTFGSFNRSEKLVDSVIAAWTAIVKRVPGSRLLLKTPAFADESMREHFFGRFEAHGLERDRIELRGPSPHAEMLSEYGEVDIALDTFPFNGGLTTLEPLWMGVPVVTFAGQNMVSRQSTALLENLGLNELIFPDCEAFIEGAVALAGDPARLGELRRQTRGRMRKSPLCQPEQFTQDLELLYRRMWRAWCSGEILGTDAEASPPVVKKTVLHVGCGPADKRALPELFQSRWDEVRLDIDPGAMPDVVASMLDMSPVADASVDAVYSSHNIEHLFPHEVVIALREFRRVLKPDGMLVMTCPDLQSVCALVAEGKLDDPAYVSPSGPIAPHDILYGHRPELQNGNLFMAHKTGFTAKTMAAALEQGGFPTHMVRRGKMFDLWVLAYAGQVDAERLEADRKSCLPADLMDAA